MKTKIARAGIIVLFLTAVYFLNGCATSTGAVKFPKPSVNYKPKKIYSISFDGMWKIINRVLEEKRITVAAIDKSAGIITTDYIEGPTTVYVAGLGGVGNSRYKYNIRVSEVNSARVRLSIVAKLEQSLHGSTGSTPYRDLSKRNPKAVRGLEGWLYEQIERALEKKG